ncbi:MAG TPA: CHAT domain-containing protein [Kofleriaceae bacterium]|jgi:CHAT domain-containing protein|nr:CHAT domain-containing protein [Kofleriaceae bacterium]
MLTSIQYPFADVRSFIADDGGRLSRPHWSAPDTESDFVRAFGGVTVRPRGGASIGGDQYRCEARWAVRFERPGLGPDRRCAFRRFYSDGKALAKFEIGIARDGSGPLTATREIDAILEQLAAVPADRTPARPLGELGPVLSRAYRRASTAHDFTGICEPWWVREGAPVTLVMYRKEEQLELPAELTPVQASQGHHSVTVAHWWQRFRGKLRPVWFLGYQPDDYLLARQLRIDLVRLHCEYQSLRMILRHIADGVLLPAPRSACSDRLQQYLNDAISTITNLRSARRSVVCETSCQLVEAAIEQVHGDQTASLVANLESQLRKLDVRPNIRRKVHNYAAEQSSLKAPVTPPSKLAEAVVEPTNGQELIAFLAANPVGTSRLLLDEECAAIERELSMTAARDVFALRSKWTVTVDEMMRHLATLTPAVIHFSGHGRAGTLTDDGDGSRQVHRDVAGAAHGAIYLEDEHRRPHCVDGRALAQMIASTAPCARIVVLNACFSDALASALCDAVDCVVGMRGAVDDAAARSFAIAFYRALGNRNSVANAVRQAAAALAAKHPSSEHLPICRTRDGISAEHLIPASRQLHANARHA